ncbi:Aldo/keto reductase [Ruminococcaceae bacterium BL-6]|nr:Aldo/keto reductase [Ruminococcaceae bacterium BL-6]
MRYKTFGKTGEKVSEICLGTWVLGGQQFGSVTEDDAIAAVHAMIDNGVNIIDTAPIYASGGSETILGKALKGSWRKKVFLITKFGSEFVDPNDSSKGTVKDSSRKNMLKSIEASLKRLQTDYIDGYLMHWDDRVGTPIEETIACMKELKKAGKVRFLGMSNLEQELADRLLEGGVLDIVQYPHNMVDRGKEELLHHYAAAGCGTMGYASLGGGILTGQFREIPTFGPGDMRGSFYKPMFTEPGFSQIQALLRVIDRIAAEHNATDAQVAINWSLAHDYMSTVLTGVRSPAEAKENCAAAAWELTGDEMSALDEAIGRIHIY